MLRARGIAAVHEAVTADGLAARVLARPDGERLLTDLDHLGQVLHDVQHRERLGLPGLLDWLRDERRAAQTSNERTRRLDTDARAVQFVTIHASKGLQYPVVYLPLLFDKWTPDEPTPLFHDVAGRAHARRRRRTGDGRDRGPARAEAARRGAAADLRRADPGAEPGRHLVGADAATPATPGLTRLLFGRERGESAVPDTAAAGARPASRSLAALTEWQTGGALVDRARPS